MAGLPTLQVLLDDGTGTFPYDITSKCRLQYDVKRGRQDEQSDVTSGSLDLRLDNTDGRFTLGSTIIASPSPIKVDARIRLKVTANAVTVNRHTGYAQSWPVEWPTGAQTLSEVTISMTDAQARAERCVLRSVLEEELLEDTPAAYYTLGEPANSTSSVDITGNQQSALTVTGGGAPVVFGTATGPGTDGLTGATFAAGQYLTSTLLSNPGAYECWFVTSTDGTLISVGGGRTLAVVGGKLNVDAGSIISAASVNDGLLHHAALTILGGTMTLYLDGVSVGTALGAVSSATNVPVAVGQGFTGSIFHVSFNASFSGARILAHDQAGTTGFAGESGTARITRTAGYANMPIGTLDTSLTNVPFEDITDKSAAEALRNVADAEMGTLFVDGSGNLTFHNRQRVTTKAAPDITIDANQLAEDTQFAVDMQGIVNFFEVTAQGTQVRQIARNTTSEASHGRYSQSKTYLVTTDAEALDRANWILAGHAEPAPRLGTLKIDMLTLTAAQQAALLAAEANTWIQVQNLPSQTPGGTTADLVIQGFQDTLSASGWVLTANVVSKPTIYPSVWILGDSTYGVLGSTTRLGV